MADVSMKEAALAYTQENGYRPALKIFPLAEKSKFPAIKGGRGCLDASSNHEQVCAWFDAFPSANIGIATGEINGVVVIDVDVDEEKGVDGKEGLKELEKNLGNLPETWEAITGRGGRHLYFRYPAGHTISNSASSIANGVDVRGNGGYVVAPPSIHQNGRSYQWEVEHYPNENPLADLPGKWVEAIENAAKHGKAGAKHQAQGVGRFTLPEKIPEGQRNTMLFKYAASMRAQRVQPSEISKALASANAERCSPPLSNADVIRIYNSALRYPEGTAADQMQIDQQRQRATDSIKPADFSDAGNAASFYLLNRGSLLWCDALGWLVWDGRRWEVNPHKATDAAIKFSQYMLDDAFAEYKGALELDENGKATIPERVKQYLAHARKTRSRSGIQNFMELSKAWFAVKAMDLDAQPFHLNTPGGVFDLRTGETLQNQPEQLYTRITNAVPSADAEGVRLWQDFLDLITEKDEDLKRYLQIAVGSCAIGTILYEGLWVAVGGGRNGKSTFYNAISRVLGDYSGSIDSTILTTDKQNRGASLATLRGKRFVTCGELEEGQRLSVQTLKRLASTDDLTIEQKYRDPETIKPSHHISLFSNFLPRVGSTDNGTWRRLNVIPFNATMPEGQNDIPNYAAVLAEKAGGAILSWIINGAIGFSELGYHLPECKRVEDATAVYKQRENWLQLFLSERCVAEKGAKIRCGDLYAAYKQYAAESGDYVRRLADFNAAMESAGFQQKTEHGSKKYWWGVRLDYPSGVGCGTYTA